MLHTRKLTVALGAAVAFLFLAAAPAAATVATGDITDGTITVQPNFGLDPVEFDLSGETPHACSEEGDPATIDVDIVGNSSSGTTSVTGVNFGSSYADFGSTTYQLDISRDTTGTFNHSGTYTGGSSPYTVNQNMRLAIDVYETSDCAQGDLACHMEVQFALTGTFTGTISPPPPSGTLVLDGSGTLSTSSCDFALVFAFSGATATVDDLTVVF